MRLSEQLRSVLMSISHNKFRVFLTSLGIIIGTFTIIVVVGIGNASEQAVADQYKRLSVESITISQSRPGGFGVRPGSSSTTRTLTKDEAVKMADELEDVRDVGVSTRTNSEIAYGSVSQTVSIQGINAAYADITNLSVLYGDLFTDEDGQLRSRVAVLGYNVAGELFDGDIEAAVGEKVLIKGASFTVVGVLDRIGGTGGVSGEMASSSSADDMAFIPYELAIKYTSGGNMRGGMGGAGQITYIARANDIDSVDAAIEEIKAYIEGITGSADTYSVVDAGSTLASAQETAKTMSSLLIAVAAIVLIVSGIGIMNVLMVAVKERTREIGILKSIGASRRMIMLEFLIEAMFISLFGGVVGVLLSFGAPMLIAMTDLQYLSSVNGVALGLCFSVATGIFFGFYPAAKASKLKPIDALNYE